MSDEEHDYPWWAMANSGYDFVRDQQIQQIWVPWGRDPFGGGAGDLASMAPIAPRRRLIRDR